jgi:hypothetical protein
VEFQAGEQKFELIFSYKSGSKEMFYTALLKRYSISKIIKLSVESVHF